MQSAYNNKTTKDDYNRTKMIDKNSDGDDRLKSPTQSPDGGSKSAYKNSDGDVRLKSPTQSPGGAKSAYARRAWSPHQANISKRKKADGDKCTLNDSFGQLALKDLNFGDDGEEEPDYLAMSLSSIKSLPSQQSSSLSSPNPRSAGGRRKGARRPLKSSGTSASTTASPTSWERSTPPRSGSLGSLKNLPTGGGNHQRMSSLTNGSSAVSVSGQSVGSMISKTKTKKELMDEIPKHIKHKLYKITDPSISIKERVQLELDMMKANPEEKRILLKFKSNFERKLYIDFRDEEHQNHTNKVQSDILIEQKKELEFLKLLDEKRKQEQHEENERLRREQQFEDDARTHKAKIISRDMTLMKDAAVVAATISVERNQKEKQREVDKGQKKLDDFRNGEGKTMMYDGQRALKEALIEQKVLPSKKLKSKLKKKEKKNKEKEEEY
jgi:hypothetical protein